MFSLAKKTFFKPRNVNSWDSHLNTILRNTDVPIWNFQSPFFFTLAYYAGSSNTGSAEMKDYRGEGGGEEKQNQKQLVKQNVVVMRSVILPPWSTSLFKFFLWTIPVVLLSTMFHGKAFMLMQTLKQFVVVG